MEVRPWLAASCIASSIARRRWEGEGRGTLDSSRPIAASRRMPVGSPLGSRSILPPATSGVLRLIPAARRAAEFATKLWPSAREKTAGWSPVTASRSWRVGSLTGVHLVSSQPRPVIHSPAGVALARSAMRDFISSRVRVPARLTFNLSKPPEEKCRCASLKPGMTKCPPRSTTFVPWPFSFSISAFVPMATILPWRTAIAWALGSETVFAGAVSNFVTAPA